MYSRHRNAYVLLFAAGIAAAASCKDQQNADAVVKIFCCGGAGNSGGSGGDTRFPGSLKLLPKLILMRLSLNLSKIVWFVCVRLRHKMQQQREEEETSSSGKIRQEKEEF
jgi:hypothetical protein